MDANRGSRIKQDNQGHWTYTVDYTQEPTLTVRVPNETKVEEA